MSAFESRLSSLSRQSSRTHDETRTVSAIRGLVTPDLIVVHPGKSLETGLLGMTAMPELLFPCLWVFISLVSAFDTYLTVRYQEHLPYHELNPIGRMLLDIDGWEPSLLIGFKFLGSTLVLGILTALYLKNRRMGLVVTAALATFQLGLLGYLTLV